jgi:hypothetical protein
MKYGAGAGSGGEQALSAKARRRMAMEEAALFMGRDSKLDFMLSCMD